jgi:uncharacterized membrane protein
MKVDFDPLWPWSLLANYLADAGVAAWLGVAVAGLVGFGLPVLARLRPWGWGPRRLFRAAAGILALVLAALLFQASGTTGGVVQRLHGFGLTMLVVVPLALAGLTVWTYLGVPGASRRRVAVILTLRLAAFFLVLLAIARPSLAVPDSTRLRSLLYVVVDASKSMNIQDERGNQSRWNMVLDRLRESEPSFRRLRDEQQVDVVFVRYGADAARFDPADPGQADGPMTDTAGMLRTVYDWREAGQPLRGLVLLSDGADNGGGNPRAEADRWRSLSCPLFALGCGNPSTPDRQKDVAITSVVVEPSRVQVKGKMMVRVLADALGFEDTTLRARLFLEDKEVLSKEVTLKEPSGNKIELPCTAPDDPGDYKLRVELDQPAGDLVAANNKLETFVTVYPGGLSVLLVDKQRDGEPQKIYDALVGEERIRVYPVFLRGGFVVDPKAGDLFQFDRKHYDVIILGDVTAKQMTAVNPKALDEIEERVRAGAGFLMIGGYTNFDNGDWKGTPVERLLPVELSDTGRGQVNEDVRIVPTPDGLDRFGYLLRIDEKDPKQAWANLYPLQGMTRLGPPTKLGVVLATGEPGGDPVLVTANYGERGRTLAFAGDTTHKWIRDPRSLEMHTRFWRHMVFWLAHQENAGGHLWVQPDTRRLPVRNELGFAAGARGKNGKELKDGNFQITLVGPDGKKESLTAATSPTGTRGVCKRQLLQKPGIYRLEVRGKATDPATGEVVEVKSEEKDAPSSRFVVYDEDVEMSRRAADHRFLRELFGEGNFRRASQLPEVLRLLEADTSDRSRAKMRTWPDWRQSRGDPRTPALFLPSYFALFVALLAGEWFLRRRWGLA